MAKSPLNPISKYSLASARQQKTAKMTRISLKNRCFALPVPLSTKPSRKNIQHDLSKSFLPNSQNFHLAQKNHEHFHKKINLNKMFLSKMKNTNEREPLIRSKPKLVKEGSDSTGVGQSRTTNLRIGIFEREHVSYYQPNTKKQDSLNGSKGKFNGIAKTNAPDEKRKWKVESSKKTPQKNSPLKIEGNSSKKKLTEGVNNPKYENKNSCYTSQIIEERLSLKIKNKICKNETSLLRNTKKTQNVEKKRPTLALNLRDQSFKKDSDAITVNTCNTLTESTSCLRIQEEPPNRKWKLLKLTDLQKSFISYNGTYYHSIN
jgi:hypothetical protein